jgi:hypothetical protein
MYLQKVVEEKLFLNAGSGSASGDISQRHGSADSDPQQNVMDPEPSVRGSFSVPDP